MKSVAITVNGMNGIGINAINGIANATQEKFIHALKKVTKEIKWMTSFRRAFRPTIEEQIEDLENALRIHNEAIEKKWCSTCKYWTPPPEGTPGFVEDHGYCDFSHTVDLTPNCSDYGLDEEGETAELLKLKVEINRLKRLLDSNPSDRINNEGKESRVYGMMKNGIFSGFCSLCHSRIPRYTKDYPKDERICVICHAKLIPWEKPVTK